MYALTLVTRVQQWSFSDSRRTCFSSLSTQYTLLKLTAASATSSEKQRKRCSRGNPNTMPKGSKNVVQGIIGSMRSIRRRSRSFSSNTEMNFYNGRAKSGWHSLRRNRRGISGTRIVSLTSSRSDKRMKRHYRRNTNRSTLD